MALTPQISHDELLKELECPVCLETIYPPIFQCENGHPICSKCKPSLKNLCPTCRVALGNIRNLALEHFAAHVELPCGNRSRGCYEMRRYNEKQKHELTCKFRPYACPFPCSPCPVTGDVAMLLSHLEVVHESNFEEGCVIDTLCRHSHPYNGEEAFSNLTIYKHLNHHFCLNFDAINAPQDLVYLVYLTFMGEEEDAQAYRYTLEIGNDTEAMTWEGVPRSIRDTREKIRETCNGLFVHRSVAQSFAVINDEEELTLQVRGYIWRLTDLGSHQDQLPHLAVGAGQVPVIGYPQLPPILYEPFDSNTWPHLYKY